MLRKHALIWLDVAVARDLKLKISFSAMLGMQIRVSTSANNLKGHLVQRIFVEQISFLIYRLIITIDFYKSIVRSTD